VTTEGFGFLRIISASVAGGVLAESLGSRIFHCRLRLDNGHTVMLALLFAALAPANISSSLAALAVFAAIFVAKEYFGPSGSQIFHPSFLGYLILSALLPAADEINVNVPALLVGGVYAALDPVTTPTSRQARLAFAVLLGGLTVTLHQWQSPIIALSYAVLISNASVGVLDEMFLPKGSKKSRSSNVGGQFIAPGRDKSRPYELMLALIIVSYIFFIGLEIWLPSRYQVLAALMMLPLLACVYVYVKKSGWHLFVWLAAGGVLVYLKHPNNLLDRFLTCAALGLFYGVFLWLLGGLKKRLLFSDIPAVLQGPKILVLTGVVLFLSLSVVLPKLP
jgi:hypothetical protein